MVSYVACFEIQLEGIAMSNYCEAPGTDLLECFKVQYGYTRQNPQYFIEIISQTRRFSTCQLKIIGDQLYMRVPKKNYPHICLLP
jgi:hypothetical protein